MRDVITQSTIWTFVGGVSAITGLVCFALSSSYDMSFGKLGYGGHLVYLLLCLIMWLLIVGAKRIRVSEKVQGVVAALIFVVICVISVLLDKYGPGKSDAFTITSYGSFALMSVSLSRKLELGFETGFSAFFLQLFASQLFKIKWFLLPIALVFCSFIIILRHYSESGVQFGYSSPNGYDPIEDASLNGPRIEISDIENINEEVHRSPSNNGVVLEESILEVVWNNRQNNDQGETRSSSSTTRLSPINDGQVSEENILDGGNEQNNEEEDNTSSLATESSYSYEDDHVSSANYQNGYLQSSPPRQLLRRRRMTRAIQNISSSLRDTLRWWHPPRLLSSSVSFFSSPIGFMASNLGCG